MAPETNQQAARRLMPEKPYRICGHRLKDGKGLCQSVAGHSTEHTGWGRCKRHGGNSPRAVRQAAQQEAMAMTIRYGDVIPIDPNDALMTELGRANGAIARCEQDMAKLVEWWGDDAHLLYGNAHWIALNIVYTDERDRLIRVAKGTLDANINERKQILAEAMSVIFVEALRTAMQEVSLTAEQRGALPLALRTHMDSAMAQLGPGVVDGTVVSDAE